jgi:hypothetical protein
VSILPRYAAVYGVIRLDGQNPAVPDIYFENAHIETMFTAGCITDNITNLMLAF